MGLFNIFKPKQKSTPEQRSSSSAENSGSQWDSLTQLQRPENSTPPQAEGPRQRTLRQGDKIIAAYLHGPDVIGQPNATVTEAERTQVLDALHDGTFSTEEQSKLLRHIALPSDIGGGRHDYDSVLHTIGDKHGLKILAFTAGAPDNFVNNITGREPLGDNFKQLLHSLTTQCPTPIEFAEQEEKMISTLERSGNPPAKIAEYQDALDSFKQNVYGKRYEYYQALDVLKDDATKQALARADAADQPRREAELRSLQTPVTPVPDQLKDNPYASPEARQAAQAGQPSREPIKPKSYPGEDYHNPSDNYNNRDY